MTARTVSQDTTPALVLITAASRNGSEQRMVLSNQFNMFSWSQEIPFCDDIWLGMQVRNIPPVDMGILRPMEEQALEVYMERERTPSDILMPLSALSQMWIFSLYEFLRTWRQRTKSDLGDQQRIADTFYEAKLIPKAIDATSVKLWTPRG